MTNTSKPSLNGLVYLLRGRGLSRVLTIDVKKIIRADSAFAQGCKKQILSWIHRLKNINMSVNGLNMSFERSEHHQLEYNWQESFQMDMRLGVEKTNRQTLVTMDGTNYVPQHTHTHSTSNYTWVLLLWQIT